MEDDIVTLVDVQHKRPLSHAAASTLISAMRIGKMTWLARIEIDGSCVENLASEALEEAVAGGLMERRRMSSTDVACIKINNETL